jgi:glycosyltransferase involved in cell wall biosynthesis
MKILYIHQHFCTRSGSIGTRSYEFAQALIAAGHEVTMFCASNRMSQTGLSGAFENGIRQGSVDGIHVIEVDLQYSNYDGFLKRILKFVRFAIKSCAFVFKINYDVVYATSTPLTVGMPGILAKKIRKKRFIFEVRDLWPDLPVAMGIIKNRVAIKFLEMFEKLCYKTADTCVGLSPGIQQGIINKGIDPNKVKIIPNGCDIPLFHDVPPDIVEEYQKKFSSGFWCVFTGAHGLANGLDAVLNTAALLKRQGNQEIKFLFVGDGKIKPHLMQRVEKEQLDNCIFWDPLPKKKLAGVLKAAQLGLMILENIPAFYYGTSPNKFFDYLAAGLPILVNYPGWMADIVKQANCGVAVRPEAPTDFANALIKLSEDRQALKLMGDNGFNLAEKQFNRDLLTAEFLSLFKK